LHVVLSWDGFNKDWIAAGYNIAGELEVVNSVGLHVTSEQKIFDQYAFNASRDKVDLRKELKRNRDHMNDQNSGPILPVMAISVMGGYIILTIVGCISMIATCDIMLGEVNEIAEQKYRDAMRDAYKCLENGEIICMEENFQRLKDIKFSYLDIIPFIGCSYSFGFTNMSGDNEVDYGDTYFDAAAFLDTNYNNPNETKATWKQNEQLLNMEEVDPLILSEKYFVCEITRMRLSAFENGFLDTALDIAEEKMNQGDFSNLISLRQYFGGLKLYKKGVYKVKGIYEARETKIHYVCPNLSRDYWEDDRFIEAKERFWQLYIRYNAY